MNAILTLFLAYFTVTGHARVLAEENGQFDHSSTSDTEPGDISLLSIRTSLIPNSPNASFTHSPNSNRRSLMVSGGTGRVLSDLQAGVENGQWEDGFRIVRMLSNISLQPKKLWRTLSLN